MSLWSPPPGPGVPAPPRLSWGRNAPLFRQFLTQGFLWQRFVGDYFLACGLGVQMPRQRFRKSIAAAPTFADEADLTVAGQVIEVKSRSLDFQRTLDLPSPCLLDTVQGWEAKTRKPMAYIVVSQISGAMVWTPGDAAAKAKWTTVRTHDRKRDIPIICYAARRFQFEPIKTLVERLRGTAS